MKNPTIEFGDKVTFNFEMKKNYDDPFRLVQKYKTSKYTSGIFLGYRFLKEGTIRYDEDGCSEFKFTRNVKVAYVSPHSTKNPIYVPLSKLEKAE